MKSTIASLLSSALSPHIRGVIAGMRRLLIATILLCSVPALAIAQNPTEVRLKAALIYNLALFVSWPAQSFSSAVSPVQVCIWQDEALTLELIRGLASRRVQRRPLVATAVSQPQDLAGCHIAYAGGDDSAAVAAALQSTGGQPVLTVHQSAAALNNGVARLFVDGERLRFEINTAAADRSRLSISSKLLKLAVVVRE
jgi:hypothetical protein